MLKSAFARTSRDLRWGESARKWCRNAGALETLVPAVEELEEACGETCCLLGHMPPGGASCCTRAASPTTCPCPVVHAQVVPDPPHDDLPELHRELEPALAAHVFQGAAWPSR